jgi:tetratricopeptide (TPR) repeat protein
MEKPVSHQASSNNPLQDLARRLYCPEPKIKLIETNPESSLSHIPWKLHWKDHGISLSSSLSSTAATPATATTTVKQPRHDESSSFFPSSYLDLRRQQNIAFADVKFQQATQASVLSTTMTTTMTTEKQTATAQSLFEQALELVPDHVDSILGYGKLLFRTGHLVDAQDKFREVLEIEPNNQSALQYLKCLERTQQLQQRQHLQQQNHHSKVNTFGILSSKGKGKILTMRESAAFHDALLERKLALEGTDDFDGGNPTNNNDNAVMDYDDTVDEDVDSKHSHKKDKKERYKKRKRKKKYKKDKKKKHKRLSRRRHCYDSDSSSTTGTS